MVRFAPLHVPLQRRIQTVSVALWMLLVPLCITVFITLVMLSFWTRTAAMAYLAYVFIDKTQERGARKIMAIRKLPLWTWFRDFFPISLRKTVDLDPSKKYIFGYHPHGIISLGAFISFGTEACDVSNVFPGLNIRLLTLESNFKLPLWRELLLSLNIASADRSSIEHILKSKNGGEGVMLVLGGAQEALNAHPYTNELVLKCRLGFIKLALRHGASIVPVFGFGENDIWDQVPNPEGSVLRKAQVWAKELTTITPPLFHGRGMFTYDTGIMPFRRPIVVVVGEPIECPKIETPTEADIKEYQAKYFAALTALYDTHKDELAPNRKKDLIIS